MPEYCNFVIEKIVEFLLSKNVLLINNIMKKSLLVLAFLACSALMLSCDKEGAPTFENITNGGGNGGDGGGSWEVADKDIIGTWTMELEVFPMTRFWTLVVKSDGTGQMKSGMNGTATYTYTLKEIVANGVTLSCSVIGSVSARFSEHTNQRQSNTLSSFSSEFPSDRIPKDFAKLQQNIQKAIEQTKI